MTRLSIFRTVLLLVPCAILNSLAMDIFAPAIPEMVLKLNTTESQIQYIVIAFMFAVGIGQPLIGLLCDKFGRRKLMLSSVFLFAISSFLTTVASTIETMTLLRFVQGLGACGALVVTFAIVNDTFSGKASFKIFSLIGCSLALAPMLAPLLGVALMKAFGGWKACFYFLGIFGLGTAFFCYFHLPETKPENTEIPSVKNLVQNYKKILSTRHFIVFSLFGTTAMAQLYLYFSIGNILYINRLGVTPFGFSLIFGLNALIYLIGNYISIPIQKHISAKRMTTIGSLLIMAGSLMMTGFHFTLGPNIAAIIFANSFMTVGVGFMIGPATGASLQPFKRLAGTASGLFGTIQYGLPALLGWAVTRFPISSSLSLALPMLSITLLSFIVGQLFRKDLHGDAFEAPPNEPEELPVPQGPMFH